MNIVITGSSKGIGKALANRCLIEGDRVIISSRSQENVNTAVEEFQLKYPKENVFGAVCDVSNASDVDALVNLAKEKLGKIDIWINNAGTNGFDRNNLVDMQVSSIKAVVETNILGTLLCCRAVLKVMLEQGSGHIFNMEGMGSNGMTMPMMLCYAMSKRAVPMIKKALVLETQGKNVGIHDISPGMVLTDLILKNAHKISVQDKTDIVGEVECYVINALTKRGKYIIWIAPKYGYNIAKAEVRRSAGDIVYKYTIEPEYKRYVSLQKVELLVIRPLFSNV